MDAKEMLQCPVCPEKRGSRRALNRHLQWHRRNADKVSTPNPPAAMVRRVVLRDSPAESASTVAGPTTVPGGSMSNSLRDPRNTARLSSAINVCSDEGKTHRKWIDAAVRCLKKRHQQDRTTLSQPTNELARCLLTENPQVHFLACVGIVVAAKYFAGTQSPRRKGCKPAEGARPAPPSPQASPKRKIRRRLFCGEQSQPASTDGNTSLGTVTSEAIGKRRRQPAQDEEWKMDIWRSYGTKETQPPSPFGCQQSPSLAFKGGSPPATTPVELWSPSSNDEPWGPDSPDEALEEDGHPDIVPGWPVFLDARGQLLDHTSTERRARVERWRTERTARIERTTAKRRHHLRTRRRSRERYASTLAVMPEAQLVWRAGVGHYRPASPSDVQLPPPPPAMSSLMRTRRLMLLPRLLPTGCRLRAVRRATQRKASEEEPLENTTAVHQKPRKRQHCQSTQSPDIIIEAPEDDAL